MMMMMGKKVACATVCLHVYVFCHRHECRVTRHFVFEDFNNGISHVMKITMSKSNPDMGLLNTKNI